MMLVFHTNPTGGWIHRPCILLKTPEKLRISDFLLLLKFLHVLKILVLYVFRIAVMK